MANEFNTNYIIALELKNLQALQELRRELAALRAEAKTPIDFALNIKPTTASNVGVAVEQKVAEAVEKGVEKGKRKVKAKRGASASASANGDITIGLDPTMVKRIEDAAKAMERAAEAMAKASPKLGGAVVDPNELAQALATAMARANRRGDAPLATPRTKHRNLSDEQRTKLKQEQSELDGIYTDTVREKKGVTTNISERARQALQRNAKVLGGALAKQVEEFEKQVKNSEEAIKGLRDSMGAGKAALGGDIGAEGAAEAVAEVNQRLANRLKELLAESQKLIQQRSAEIAKSLESGVVEVKTRTAAKTSRGNANVARAVRASGRRLENAIDALSKSLQDQVQSLIDSMADQVAAIANSVPSIAVPVVGGGAGGAAAAVNQAAARRRRVLKGDIPRVQVNTGPAYQLNNTLFEEADPARIEQAKQRHTQRVYGGYARRRDRANRDPEQTKLYRWAEEQVEKMRKAEGDVDWTAGMHGPKPMSPLRQFIEHSAGNRIPLDPDTHAAITSLFGSGAVQEGRLRPGETRSMLRRTGAVLPVLREMADARKITDELREKYATQVSRAGLSHVLPAPGDINIGHVANLSDTLGTIREGLRRRMAMVEVLTPFRRPDRVGADAAGVRYQRRTDPNLAGMSIAELREEAALLASRGEAVHPRIADQVEQHLISRYGQDYAFQARRYERLKRAGLTDPSRLRKPLPENPEQLLSDVAQLRQLREAASRWVEGESTVGRGMRRVRKSRQAGYQFTPFGEKEIAYLTSILEADITDLETPFGKQSLSAKRAFRVIPGTDQAVTRSIRDHVSALLQKGGEEHYGQFQGFTDPIFQPDIRDIALGHKPLRDITEREAAAIAAMSAGRNVGTNPRAAEFVRANATRVAFSAAQERERMAAEKAASLRASIAAKFGPDFEARHAAETAQQSEHDTLWSLYDRAERLTREQRELRKRNREQNRTSKFSRDKEAAAKQASTEAFAALRARTGATTLSEARELLEAAGPRGYSPEREELDKAVRTLRAAESEAAGTRSHREQLLEQLRAQRRAVRFVPTPTGDLKERLLEKWSGTSAFAALRAARADGPVIVTSGTTPGLAEGLAARRMHAGTPAHEAAVLAAAAIKAQGGLYGAAGGAGRGGGGKTPPPGAPPTGGPPGGPGDWDKWASAIKSLETVRLTGLANDLKAMADAMVRMKGAAGIMLPQALRNANLRAEERLARTRTRGRLQELDAKANLQAARDAGLLQRAELRAQRTAAWAAAQGLAGPRSVAATVGAHVMGSGTSALPTDPDLVLNALTGRFLKQRNQLATRQMNHQTLLHEHLNAVQAGQPGYADRLVSSGSRIDAIRASMFATVQRAAALNPGKFGAVLGDISQFGQTMSARLDAESQLRRVQALGDPVNWAKGHQGPQPPPQAPIIAEIKKRRDEEERLAQAITKRAEAEFEAIKVQNDPRNRNFVERFSNRLGTLSMYALGAGGIYAGFAAGRAALGTAMNAEAELARIQGVIGNQTFTERQQVGAGVWRAAIDFGQPISAALATAKTFAQTGIGVDATQYMTAQSLRGQLGAGLEGTQATEMLIAVDNITRGLVSAADILDRISRVEAKYAVTAQDLSVALQRVGSLAMQLQPQQIGRMDALDLVIGATTAQVQETRVTGSQAATALKFILSRFTQPDVAKNLQNVYGIQLGGHNPNEMRPLVDILGDVAKRYQGLMASGQTGVAAQLLTQVAGARQVNQAAALFGNWNEVMEAATESAKAWGDTQRRVEIQMETLAFQTERAKNALLALSTNILERGGGMALLKGVANVVGTGADVSSPVATALPLLLSLGSMGAGAVMRSRGARSAAALDAMPATYRQTVGGAFRSNWASFLNLGGAGLSMLGGGLLPLAGIAAVSGIGYGIYNHVQGQNDRYGLPSMGDIQRRVRDSDLFKEWAQKALQNSMTPEDLTRTVAGAAGLAMNDVVSDPKIKALGLTADLFTNDDARRQYHASVYDTTVKAFVERMKEAVPEIRNIKDEAEQTATALRYLKQASMASTMTSGFVEAWRQGQMNELQSRIEANVQNALKLGPDKPGSFSYRLRDSARDRRLANQNVARTFNDIFDILGPGIANARFGRGTVSNQIAEMMKADRSVSFGKALDRLMMGSVERSSEETELENRIAARLKLPATMSYEDRRQRIMAESYGFGESGLALWQKLVNEKNLDEAIYSSLRTRFAGISGGQDGDVASGGLAGSEVINRSIQRVVARRVRDLQKQGLTGDAAALEALNQALENSMNRPASKLNIMRLESISGGRGLARDRMLEVLLRYGTAESVALDAGSALRRAGVGVDVAAERAQNAQGLLRGLFEARAQTQSDVFRMASRLGNYDEVYAILRQQRNTTGVFDDEGSNERAVQTLGSIIGSVTNADPAERRRMEAQLNIHRAAAAALVGNDDLFAALSEADRASLKEFAFGRTMTEAQQLAFVFSDLTRISEKLVKVTTEQVVAQQRGLYNIERNNALEQERARSSAEWAAMSASLGVRRAEVLGGPTAAFAARMAESRVVESGTLAQIRAKEAAQLSMINWSAFLGMPGFMGQAGELARLRVTDEAERERAAARDRGSRDRTRLQGEYDIEDERLNMEFAVRMAEAARGTYGGLLTRMQYLQPGSIEAREAMRAYQVEIAQRRQGTANALREASLSGVRGSLVSFDTLRGEALGPRMYKPALDAVSQRVADSFVDAIAGPHGLLGDQLNKIFSSNLFMEAELIRNAHIQGITTGFSMAGVGSGAPVGTATVTTTKGSMWKQLGLTTAFMAGSIGGGALGTSMGVNQGQNYGSEGGQMGATIGALLGSPGGPVGMAIGSVIGGALGGLLGGRVGKKGERETPEFMVLERIERGTRDTVTAIENQTRSLLELENRLLNVPAGFTVPSYAVAAGGGYAGTGGAPMVQHISQPIYITITEASDPRKTVELVRHELRAELRSKGTFVTPRR